MCHQVLAADGLTSKSLNGVNPEALLRGKTYFSDVLSSADTSGSPRHYKPAQRRPSGSFKGPAFVDSGDSDFDGMLASDDEFMTANMDTYHRPSRRATLPARTRVSQSMDAVDALLSREQKALMVR